VPLFFVIAHLGVLGGGGCSLFSKAIQYIAARLVTKKTETPSPVRAHMFGAP